ncbi:ATP-binding protein [Catenovulum sediminis]|uniref:histidine kinase n=1 Tax=Catenovulum sediminis TaxID=1740262 RepID=A0ABV1REM5_9ALTE
MTIGICGYIVHATSVERDNLIEEQAKNLVDSIGYASEYNLISINKTGLQSKLRDINATSSLPIANILVYDDTGELFVASNYTQINHSYNEAGSYGVKVTRPDNLRLIVSSPIFAFDNSFNQTAQWQGTSHTAHPIGHVVLLLDLSAETYQRFITNLNLFVLIGIAALLTAMLMIALVNRVIRPVKAFVEAVKRIGSGDLRYRLDIPVQYEFNELRDGINVMAAQLQHNQSKLESEIEDATRDLQQNLLLVEEKNAELDIARKEALEASKVKSQFLATMSHEVRTPLNAIVGFTKELEKAELPDPYEDYVKTINASADSLIAIVNDVLDFSKIEAGKMELDHSAFNLLRTVEEVTKLMARDAFAKGLVFSVESDALPIAAIGDRHRFKQILSNLLSNAIKFTPKGFVILRLKINSVSESQHMLTVEIQDSGIGISKDKQSKLFKAFHQADASTTRKYGGTGLGLAITHGLVSKMNGKLSIESSLGKGSTFTLNLPITTSKPNRVEKLSRLNKALVLDPHPVAYTGYRMLFQQLGIAADIYSEIDDWENQLRQQDNYDLIVIASDSDEESLELLPLQAAYAAKQQTAALVVLAVPLYTSLPETHKSLLGDWPVTEKPFTFSKLEQVWSQHNKLSWLAEEDDTEVVDISANQPEQGRIKMLAVDDNETNLKLLSAILRKGRVNLTTTFSGKDACCIAEEEEFDLILMDVQMPEMDGIQTTAKIRQGILNKHTPIIAFTAHAFKEEREKLLRSGMDDYLAKPIDMVKFNQLVNKWVVGASEQNIKPPTKAQVDNEKCGIDWTLALQKANNNHEIAVEMLTMLASTFDDVERDIKHAASQNDFATLLDVVHKFHGSTCYSGVPYLRSLANNLESQLKKDVHINVDELIESLLQEMQVVKNGLAELQSKS